MGGMHGSQVQNKKLNLSLFSNGEEIEVVIVQW